MMDRGTQIISLQKEIQAMPEYHLYVELLGLRNSIYMFDANFINLHNFITNVISSEQVNLLLSPRNQNIFQNVCREIIRLIHNLVAGAISLIDHTRRLYNRLYNEKHQFPEYQERVKNEFISNELAQFVKNLRQYCQHYKAPEIFFVGRVEKLEDGFVISAMLPMSELLTYDGWSSKSKAFLARVEGDVDILEIATLYWNKVIDFYTWFQKRQREIHVEEIKRFRQKEAALLLLQLEDHLDLWLENKEYRDANPIFDEIFVDILDTEEFAELERIVDHSQHVQRAIEMVERHFPLPQETKVRIIRLYKEYDRVAD